MSLLGFLRRPRASALPDTPPPARPRLIGVGHSHVVALKEADELRRREDGPSPPPAHFIQMLDPAYQPMVMPDGSLSPGLAGDIKAAIAADAGPFVAFDCISGNEYHAFSLANHPRPFDFVLPGRPDLPLQPGVEIIPSELMRGSFRFHLEGAIAALRALRAAVDVPLWHVQSPPPVPDNDYIRQHPIQFAEQIEAHGVGAPFFRMKLWLLQSDILRGACEEAGIGFVPVPAEACDENGFMRQPGWIADPVHAGTWYGRIVLRQLEALV